MLALMLHLNFLPSHDIILHYNLLPTLYHEHVRLNFQTSTSHQPVLADNNLVRCTHLADNNLTYCTHVSHTLTTFNRRLRIGRLFRTFLPFTEIFPLALSFCRLRSNSSDPPWFVIAQAFPKGFSTDVYDP